MSKASSDRAWNLLEKTELKIHGVHLRAANLNAIAAAVADFLGVDREHVLVTDVRDDCVALDILLPSVPLGAVAKQEQALLATMAALPGVALAENASLSAEGVLGWIAFDRPRKERALRRARRIGAAIAANVSKRAIVFSTGGEVAGGEIEDTNTPMIRAGLEAAGYAVKAGPTLPDDEQLIAASLREACDAGYGLIVTTGGVGAEDKDHTVEGLLQVDPTAAAPYISHFKEGTGRHHKGGVRIAVAQAGDTMLFALPGPNDEVSICMNVLAKHLADIKDKRMLAEELVSALRSRLNTRETAHSPSCSSILN